MPKFVSEVLEPQQREKRKARGFARAAAAYVLISAAALGGVIYATNLEDKGAQEAQQTAACSHPVPRSVFTTGDPLLDQQILWFIANDPSEGNELSASMVTHIWENRNFAFPTSEANALWEEAVSAVTSIGEISKPALMLAEGNVIVPYNDSTQLQGMSWQEVSVTPQYEVGTMLTAPGTEQEEYTPVPVVFMPINNANVVPAPVYDDSGSVQMVNYSEVCNG